MCYYLPSRFRLRTEIEHLRDERYRGEVRLYPTVITANPTPKPQGRVGGLIVSFMPKATDLSPNCGERKAIKTASLEHTVKLVLFFVHLTETQREAVFLQRQHDLNSNY